MEAVQSGQASIFSFIYQVVGGLIGIDDTWIRSGGVVRDVNNCKPNRVYMINSSLGTINFNLFPYGNLLCYQTDAYHTQIATSMYNNKRYTRTSDNNGHSWSQWREF